MDKSIVLSTSKGSEGYVAARGLVGSSYLTINRAVYSTSYSKDSPLGNLKENNILDLDLERCMFPQLSGNISNAALSGGTTNLTVKEYSARLISPTELKCDGPVEWQVVEYN